jgi:hypothetical protein
MIPKLNVEGRGHERKNEKIQPNSTMIPQVVRFLEELRIPKSPFEIN